MLSCCFYGSGNNDTGQNIGTDAVGSSVLMMEFETVTNNNNDNSNNNNNNNNNNGNNNNGNNDFDGDSVCRTDVGQNSICVRRSLFRQGNNFGSNSALHPGLLVST